MWEPTCSPVATLRVYVEKLNNWANSSGMPVPQVLVVLPPDIDDSHYDEDMNDIFGKGASERVKQLRQEMRVVADSLGLAVLDSSEHCFPAPQDGIHLDAENNKKLADAIHAKLAELL